MSMSTSFVNPGHGPTVDVPKLVQHRPDNNLQGVIEPGDVLFVKGTGGLLELGTAGGVMGHVMLVIKGPERIGSNSDHARPLKSVWPAGVQEIWKVRTLESARGRAGLHEANLYLYVEPGTATLILLGELSDKEFDYSNEATELWQSPPELRLRLSDGTVQEVLGDMKEQNASANWSWTTAARAVLLPDWQLSDSSDKQRLLQEIQDCWARDPICTSVVIIFWQRWLCKLASVLVARQDIAEVTPSDLILQWLPLKADRSLPGPLLDTMQRCGWTKRTIISPDLPNRQRLPLAKREQQRARSPSCHAASISVKPHDDAAVATTACAASRSATPAGTSIAISAPPHKAASSTTAVPTPPHGAQLPPLPQPQRLVPSLTAKYCASHHRSAQRPKAEPRILECSVCRVAIETNYAEMALCPPCSNNQGRCMVCGTSIRTHEAAPSLDHTAPIMAQDPARNMQAPSFGPVPHANPAAPVQQSKGGPPRYCHLHDRSDRRKKGEPRIRECKACHMQIETNYAEMSFCPPCSQRFDRCMVCGNSGAQGPPAWARFPPSIAPIKAEEVTNANRLRISPHYCSRHDSTLKRAKAEPKCRECTVCHMVVESNYAEFSLCPPCSDREHRCVLCGCPDVGVAPGGSCVVPLPLHSLLAR
mmetsp:Transcript_38215/g.73415  ORF Transcript_38215/g.73415 Transcript_38215/m.73415 type:complete len:648 (+) Transcript_38215:68-2011(+)